MDLSTILYIGGIATLLFATVVMNQLYYFYSSAILSTEHEEEVIHLTGVIVQHQPSGTYGMGFDMRDYPGLIVIRFKDGQKVSFHEDGPIKVGMTVEVSLVRTKAPWPACYSDTKEYYFATAFTLL